MRGDGLAEERSCFVACHIGKAVSGKAGDCAACCPREVFRDLQDAKAVSDGARIAGKHLQHVACRVGEAASGKAGGWLARQPKLWRLPLNMHPLAEVKVPPAYSAKSGCVSQNPADDETGIAWSGGSIFAYDR